MNFFECRETKLDDKREMKCSETASLLVKKKFESRGFYFYFFIRVKSKFKKITKQGKNREVWCGQWCGNW